MATYTINGADAFWTAGPTVTVDQKLSLAVSGEVVVSTGPTQYIQPEGGYPVDGFPSGHTLSPGDATRVTFLAIIAVASGATPSALSGSRSRWITPRWTLDTDGTTRIWTASASDLANASGVDGPWDLYFAFADTFYGDNSGSFTVTTTVIQVDRQVPDLIGLPGALTQADYDNAEICSKLGVLTPANRKRRVDGRTVCDLVAPYLNPGPREG